MNLHLDLSRGKPCIEQLNLSMPMMDELEQAMKILCLVIKIEDKKRPYEKLK